LGRSEPTSPSTSAPTGACASCASSAGCSGPAIDLSTLSRLESDKAAGARPPPAFAQRSTFQTDDLLSTAPAPDPRSAAARLSHLVWIVEAHGRAACGSGDRVLATVPGDATSSDYQPRQCAIAVPGAVAVFDPTPMTESCVREVEYLADRQC